MHKHLEDGNRTHVDVLYLLWSDVLSLAQLEDVLLPVDDAQRAVLTQALELHEYFLIWTKGSLHVSINNR